MKTGFTSLDPEIRKLLDGKDAELASLRARLAEVERERDHADGLLKPFEDLVDELRSERDRLRKACEAVLDRHNYQGTGEPWPSLFDTVRAALSPPERTHP